MNWRPLLLPLNPLYRGAVALRTAAYRRGWFSTERLEVPVISVGNLTFGGTGKTPTVIALVRDLIALGRRPAILTRGYKRRDDRQIVVVGPELRHTADAVGDEPLEMARRLPGVPVIVDADRVRGGREAIRRGADVVLLDDGFQHLRLERDLDLVVVDAGDPWGGGRLPPMGRLREPVDALGRADAVLVTKVPSEWRSLVAEIEKDISAANPDLPVLVARVEPNRVLVPGDGWCDAGCLTDTRVFAVAGIGRPQGFSDTLVEAGAQVIGHEWLPDHHDYTAEDLARVVAAAKNLDAVLVTTGKDAVKLPPDAPAWVIETELRPLEGHWQALWRLLPQVVS